MTDKPRWDPQGPGAEAMWRGAKGERGEKGPPGDGMTHGARRAIFWVFVTVAVLATAALTLGARTAGHLQATQSAQARIVQRLGREVRSQCRLDGDLAGAPVAVNPVTKKPAVLGVKIVSDFRTAWHQAGCPGRLAAPSPSFERWARFYHLPVS